MTGHVIYNPAYTYKFQLKTTLIVTLLTDSEVLILFAEINQILLKISFIQII